MSIESIKQDLYERFVKFETLRGLYRVPAGLLVLFTVWTHLQFALQVYFTVEALAMIGAGLRQIFVNRVKQEAKLKQQVAQRIMADVSSQ